MPIGSYEFTEHGVKPFDEENGASGAGATSGTVDINNIQQKGITLCDGFIRPAAAARLNMQLWDNTLVNQKNVMYRMGKNSTTSTYNTGSSSEVRITNENIDPDTFEGCFFQIWFKFGENQTSTPYEDVSFHWRCFYFLDGSSSAGVHQSEGQGKVITAGDTSKAKFIANGSNVTEYRLRCYNFLSH